MMLNERMTPGQVVIDELSFREMLASPYAQSYVDAIMEGSYSGGTVVVHMEDGTRVSMGDGIVEKLHGFGWVPKTTIREPWLRSSR
jgi:hypothetical protein